MSIPHAERQRMASAVRAREDRRRDSSVEELDDSSERLRSNQGGVFRENLNCDERDAVIGMLDSLHVLTFQMRAVVGVYRFDLPREEFDRVTVELDLNVCTGVGLRIGDLEYTPSAGSRYAHRGRCLLTDRYTP